MSPESMLSTPAKHTDREEPKGSGIGTPKLDFRAHHRQSRSSTPLNFGKERKILFQTPLPSSEIIFVFMRLACLILPILFLFLLFRLVMNYFNFVETYIF